MDDDNARPAAPRLVQIEPGDRLVVLAQTMQARSSGSEAAWAEGVARWHRFGEGCLGQALYRHRSVFQGTSAAPVWTHLELSYFRGIVPADAIQDLVSGPQPAGGHLLRAEILLTTPSSFVMPVGWRGLAHQPHRLASLEYIDVDPARLRDYRDIMRRHIGPAAAKLVEADRIGTFRAMETAAVLCHDPSLTADWNQVHLCEVDADGFEGFGQMFDTALREGAPEEGFGSVFSGLGGMRTIPRWTFNVPVVEADLAVGQVLRAAAPPA